MFSHVERWKSLVEFNRRRDLKHAIKWLTDDCRSSLLIEWFKPNSLKLHMQMCWETTNIVINDLITRGNLISIVQLAYEVHLDRQNTFCFITTNNACDDM